MRFNRLWRVLVLIFALQAANASVLKFADLLVRENMLQTKIVSSGVTGANVTRLKRIANLSIGSLLTSNQNDLYRAVKNLPVASRHQAKKKKLLSVLRRPADSIDTDKFIDTLNDLAFIADRYGINSASSLSCTICLSDQLSLIGVKASLKQVSSDRLKSILKKIPADPAQLVKYSQRRLKRLNAVNVLGSVGPSDQKAFALFLELATNGDDSYSRFAKAVVKYSKSDDKKTYLAGPKATNSLWKLINSQLTDEKAEKLAHILENSLDGLRVGDKEKFYKGLESAAGDDEAKLASVKKMRKNDCYFK